MKRLIKTALICGALALSWIGSAGAAPIDGLGTAQAQSSSTTTSTPPAPATSSSEGPTRADISRFYPERASRLGVSGRAVLSCRVQADGTLAMCSIVSEAPADMGFGAAAMQLSHLFKMRPKTSVGRPTAGGTITIPIRFEPPKSPRPPTVESPGTEEPSLTSGVANVAYAIKAICGPYVLDGVAQSALPVHLALVRDDGWRALGLQQSGDYAVRVGIAGFVHVSVASKGDTRQCDVSAARARPADLRDAALGALAARPEGFAPTKSRYLPGRFAAEDRLCSRAGSIHPGAFALLSTAHPEQSNQLAILFTLLDSPTRDTSCDHEGVKMNFRTLAAP